MKQKERERERGRDETEEGRRESVKSVRVQRAENDEKTNGLMGGFKKRKDGVGMTPIKAGSVACVSVTIYRFRFEKDVEFDPNTDLATPIVFKLLLCPCPSLQAL